MKNQYTENPTAERQTELKGLVKKTKRDRLVGYTKAVGGVIAPIVFFGATAAFCECTFKNEDLANLVSLGLGIGIGATTGPGYIEMMRDIIGDIRYASSRLREYRTELQNIE